jgi:predicted ArsR family transcriptional regulator
MANSSGGIDGSSRAQILALLRRGERSVDELAAAVGVSDNAVRLHLATLERDGLVHAARLRRDGQIGKPATVYAVTRDGGDAHSKAYEPVLTSLLTTLAGRLDARGLSDLLRDVGRQLASKASVRARGERGESGTRVDDHELEAWVDEAARVLRAIGGDADVERTDTGFVIRAFACPLSRSVDACPPLCVAIEELVAGITGAKVKERCDRSDRPRCTFAITPRPARR